MSLENPIHSIENPKSISSLQNPNMVVYIIFDLHFQCIFAKYLIRYNDDINRLVNVCCHPSPLLTFSDFGSFDFNFSNHLFGFRSDEYPPCWLVTRSMFWTPLIGSWRFWWLYNNNFHNKFLLFDGKIWLEEHFRKNTLYALQLLVTETSLYHHLLISTNLQTTRKERSGSSSTLSSFLDSNTIVSASETLKMAF